MPPAAKKEKAKAESDEPKPVPKTEEQMQTEKNEAMWDAAEAGNLEEVKRYAPAYPSTCVHDHGVGYCWPARATTCLLTPHSSRSFQYPYV